MRPSHLFLAAMTGAASLVSAESATVDCSTTTTTTGSGYLWPSSWPIPTPNSTSSLSTLGTTVTYLTDTTTTTTSAAGSSITAFTSSTSGGTGASSTPRTVTTNGATPVDGLSGDRSVLGLVIFVALSLCLL